jgi:hypothetical protein
LDEAMQKAGESRLLFLYNLLAVFGNGNDGGCVDLNWGEVNAGTIE